MDQLCRGSCHREKCQFPVTKSVSWSVALPLLSQWRITAWAGLIMFTTRQTGFTYTLYTFTIVHCSAGQPSTLFIQRHSRQLCGHLLGMLWLWSSRTTSSTWGASITRWKRSPTLVVWVKFIMVWLTGYTEEWWQIIIPDHFIFFQRGFWRKLNACGISCHILSTQPPPPAEEHLSQTILTPLGLSSQLTLH